MEDTSLFIACINPQGEAEDYDGCFYKDNEFDDLAQGLMNKPVLYNHNEDLKIGKVVSAWASTPDGEAEGKRQLFAMCEIDDNTRAGGLAKRLIDEEIVQDVSLGHGIQKKRVNGMNFVTDKKPLEISICEQGARKHTHIYGTSWREEKAEPSVTPYIKVAASANSTQLQTTTMSTPVETSAPAVESVETVTTESPEAAAPKVVLTKQMLTQFKALQEQLHETKTELDSFKESGRKLREAEMNGGVKAYMEKVIAGNAELKNYTADYEDLMKSMVESDKAVPLVKFIKCLASNSTASVVEMEKQYQLQKAKDLRIKELTEELKVLGSDAFALPEERINVGASAGLAGNKRQRVPAAAKAKNIFEEIGESMKTMGNGMPRISANEIQSEKRMPMSRGFF